MPGNFRAQVEGYKFWDSTGALNGMARYCPVALATAAEVTAANAAGVPGNVGEICVQMPVAASFGTRRMLGISHNSAKNGQDLQVVLSGVAWVMMNAACALDSVLFAAAATTRTDAQSPIVDNPEMMIAHDPSFAYTYNFVLCDDTALPAANTIHYPIGFALKAATNQYDLIQVELIGGYVR